MKLAAIILYNFIAGSICLMFGVNIMSRGLEKLNPNAIKKILGAFTRNVPLAFFTGTAVTALLQSSTAVTILTVGLVNSGLMKLTSAVGIIYGANLGTTVTAQLMSLNITGIGIPLMGIGLFLVITAKKGFMKNIGQALLGMGFLFTGLRIMNSGVPYIKESSFAYNLFKNYGYNPYIGLVLGMITTMLVQSSSATVGLTIILFNSGLIGFDAALGLTLGDNIGTCITAQLASMGVNISGRRTAWAHTLYNVIGVLIAMTMLQPFSQIVLLVTSILGQNETRLVANAHTIFNMLSAALFLPVTTYYVKFIEWLVPGKR